MPEQPRGRPAGQAAPSVGFGRNALTALGGGVLVLAVVGGAWALFGRDTKTTPAALGPRATTSAPATTVQGPALPVTTATSSGPVAARTPAATVTQKAAPAPAAVTTSKPVVSTPPAVTAPQQAGTVARADYTFKVARGDTLWKLAKATLRATGRSTSNANVVTYVHRLYGHNASVIGSDPNLILPGQVIVWPAGL